MVLTLLTEDLDKKMDSLEVRELIVVGIHTDTEEETGVSSVDDLVVPELETMRPSGEGKSWVVEVRAARSASVSGDTTKREMPLDVASRTHLDKVGLIFLVSRRYEPMYFSP